MKRTLSCAVAVAAACLISLAAAPARGADQSVEHTIRSGDNLHLIAGFYYGNPRQWQRIWRANRKHLAGPGRLVPGKVLLIERPAGDCWLGSYEDFLSRVRGK